MRIWQNEHTFNHNWETIVQAAVRKYPNPLNPNVVSQDVLSRKLTPDGKLRTHQLYGTDFSGLIKNLRSMHFGHALRWLQDPGISYGSERAEIDPKQRTYSLRSKSLSFKHLIVVEEKLDYFPHPNDPQGKTVLIQSASIKSGIWQIGAMLESLFEEYIYSKMALKGPQAIEWVIDQNDFTLPPVSSPPPPQQPPAPPTASTPSLAPFGQSNMNLNELLHASVQQVNAKVKHLAKLAADEYFLIM